FQVPIVEDAPHDQHVGGRQRVCEEAARTETQAVAEPERGNVFVKNRTDGWQVEPAPGEVRVREGNLHRYGALGRSDIHKCFVITPGEFSGNGPRRRQAETGHGGEEEAEAGRVGVDRVKKVLAALDLVLRPARAQAI